MGTVRGHEDVARCMKSAPAQVREGGDVTRMARAATVSCSICRRARPRARVVEVSDDTRLAWGAPCSPITDYSASPSLATTFSENRRMSWASFHARDWPRALHQVPAPRHRTGRGLLMPFDAGRTAGERIARHSWLAEKPDLLHVSSLFEGFEGAAIVPSLADMPQGMVISATAYDVIPPIFSDIYLEDTVGRRFYESRIDRMRRCDILLAISEATRTDIIDRVGIAPERVVNILGAVDRVSRHATQPSLDRTARLQWGLSKPYVMYTGGIDHRKNVEAAIRAFGLLAPETRAAYQWRSCAASAKTIARGSSADQVRGLPDDGVVLTGFVSRTTTSSTCIDAVSCSSFRRVRRVRTACLGGHVVRSADNSRRYVQPARDRRTA